MALTSVDDVAAMLRWGSGERSKYTAQIAPYLAAASEIIEKEAGPFEQRDVQLVVDGGAAISLPYAPATVTAVEYSNGSGGWTAASGSWSLDASSGVLYGPFSVGVRNVRVSLTVGYPEDEIPDAARLAATMVAVDMWAIASQRAPGLDDAPDPAYLTPKVVRNLLSSINTLPGFA